MDTKVDSIAGSSHRGNVQGFTLIELLVVIAVIAILMTIGLAAYLAAWERSKRLTCQSRLRQIAQAWMLYLDDNGGLFYRGLDHNYDFGGWQGRRTNARYRPLNRHLGLDPIATSGDVKVFRCPADTGGEDYSGTAFRSMGNSYQANIMLIGPTQLPEGSDIQQPEATINAAINVPLANLARERLTDHEHLLLVGDQNWVTQWDPVNLTYCGRAWHGDVHHYNMAFLAGNVGYIRIEKGLYVNERRQYRVQPFTELNPVVRDLQKQYMCPCGKP